MGLSVAISGGIVLFVVVYVLLMIPGIVSQTVSITKASSDIFTVENSILKTEVGVRDVRALAGSDMINFTLKNFGTEKLWNFEKFNVIISYSSIAGQKTELLRYSGACPISPLFPAKVQWCVESIAGNYIEPKILNTNETMLVFTKVNQLVAPGAVDVAVSTDNGIVARHAVAT
jgi:hypothetical protein